MKPLSHKLVFFAAFLSFFFYTDFSTVSAQENITLSVTPPFFQLTVTPGETWNSSLKVVNVNDFDLSVYASTVNFESHGESGKGKFTPLLSDTPEYREASLAGWIDITENQINVAPGQSVKVPFSIYVPENASPGGHYAAILIGNQPVSQAQYGPKISVSSFISSLIFVRVAGDVVEDGSIREFATSKLFYTESDVPLSLRFENEGNVHLLPQGEITIYNMWGKERGKILVNQRTEFGNVLPDSTRLYEYKWTGDLDTFEIGKYKAVATLSFGSNGRQNISRTTSFWVVPLKPVLTMVGIIAFVLLSITWFIRRYIRNALGITNVDTNSRAERAALPRSKQLARPLVDGVMDLRNINKEDEAKPKMTVVGFVKKYKLFFVFLLLLIITIFGMVYYFDHVLVSEHDFQLKEITPEDN